MTPTHSVLASTTTPSTSASPLAAPPLEVAVAQLNAHDDLEKNLAQIATLVARAADRGVKLVSLPEGCVLLGSADKKRALAEPAPTVGAPPHAGRALVALASLAETHALTIAAGGVALASPDPLRPDNAHVVFGPTGATLAVYRKIHLFDVDLADGTTLRESDSSTAGDPERDVVTVDVGGWRLGLTICYDLRFPELFRRLVDRGVHALLVPSAFTVPTGKDHWHVLLRARAIESQSYVLAAAQWGRHPEGRLTYGKSLIADPWGDVIAQASDGVGLAYATLDPRRVNDVRAQLPSLRHRRMK